MRKMKDSGIEGADIIPFCWETTRLSYECYIRARLGWRGLKADEYVEEGYAFISAFNIQNGNLVWEPLNFISKERFDESPEIKIQVGDVLIVKDGAGVGKCARVDELPIGGTAPNSSIAVITPNENQDYRYVCYYLQSPVFNNFVLLLYNGMGVPHLTQEVMSKIKLLTPPLSQQQKIADYLDRKCSEIDALVIDIQNEIKTLEEYKRSVITEAVTKGLDPDVEMKDSGVEWIGKVPKHWKIIRGKYILICLNKPICEDDGVITCFRDGEVTLRSSRREDGFTMADKEIGYQGIDVGDLVVHGMDGFAGAIGISDSRGKASPVLNVLGTGQNKQYIMYYLRSMAYNDVFTAIATGIRVRSCDLRWNKLADLPYPVPPIGEQDLIVDYINKQLDKSNEVIAIKKQQLETLTEYKKSLIYEYVTGKKEV